MGSNCAELKPVNHEYNNTGWVFKGSIRDALTTGEQTRSQTQKRQENKLAHELTCYVHTRNNISQNKEDKSVTIKGNYDRIDIMRLCTNLE